MHVAWLVRQLAKPAENKVPDGFMSAWRTAVQTKSKSAKGALFSAFLQSGKDWSMKLVCVSMYTFFAPDQDSHQNISEPGRAHYREEAMWSQPHFELLKLQFCPLGWRTRDQLLKLHHGNAAIVDSIIDKKISAGQSLKANLNRVRRRIQGASRFAGGRFCGHVLRHARHGHECGGRDRGKDYNRC